MKKNYTEAAKERCLELKDTDIDAIWADIESMPEDSDSDKWKKKLLRIAAEFTLSSRYALMRILQSQALGIPLGEATSEDGFDVTFDDGLSYRFEDISVGHAVALTHDELEQYEKLMLDKASGQSDADYKTDLQLIHKALQSKNEKTTLLSREDAFKLGHTLNFELSEMEWFLLRVLNVDGGLCYNTSNDLIEAYGFLTSKSSKAVAQLKQEYALCYGGDKTVKAVSDVKETDFTLNMDSSLREMARSWSPDDQDRQFMLWIGAQAPFLDTLSCTAQRIYRNIAGFAYELATGSEAPGVDEEKSSHPHGVQRTDFIRCIKRVAAEQDLSEFTRRALCENGTISHSRCRMVADTLLEENMVMSLADQSDKLKPYHYPIIDGTGKLHLEEAKLQYPNNTNKVKKNGKIPKTISSDRVTEILCGCRAVGKNDMLYLLWVASNLCWFQSNATPKPKQISVRFNDFIDAAENCLDAAGLPTFYPPHLFEQCLMLSIVYAYASPETGDPAEVYENICSSLIEPRKKREPRKQK